MRMEGYGRFGRSFQSESRGGWSGGGSQSKGRGSRSDDRKSWAARGGWSDGGAWPDDGNPWSGQRDEEESEAYRELKAQLTEYYRKGVKVSLGGVRMPVSKIARICAVREEGKYMGDYIIDEAGELIEVRFDRVSR